TKTRRTALTARVQQVDEAIRRLGADLQTKRAAIQALLLRLNPMIGACVTVRRGLQLDPALVARVERGAEDAEKNLTTALADSKACTSADAPDRARRAVGDALETATGIERIAVALNSDPDSLVDLGASIKDGATVLTQLNDTQDDVERFGREVIRDYTS